VRAALIGVIVLAALTAAPAAAWQEVPFRTLPGGGVATCLRATGTEGGLAALGPLGRRATPVDLLAAGTARPAVRARLRFPIAFECPAVREQGGAGVAAAPVVRPGTERIELRAAVRDPGGAFGVPVALGRAPEINGAHDVAVTSHGDAVVAWIQEAGERRRIAVARRAPGAPFGAVQGLTPWSTQGDYILVPLAAALDPDGRATVAWARHRTLNRLGEDAYSVRAAVAPAGGTFGPAQILSRSSRAIGRIDLVAAAGGAALLAHDSDRVLRLFERTAGARGFGPPRQLGVPDAANLAEEASEPALALRDDGAAVVAWRQGTEVPAVRALTRVAGAAFGADREVAPGRPEGEFGGGFVAYGSIPEFKRAVAPADDQVRLRAALSDTGRVALAWTAPRPTADLPRAAYGVAGTLDGGFGAPVVLGSPARAALGVAALLLPGGEPAVAWADNTGDGRVFGLGDLESPAGGGRIHLARADGVAPPPALPPRAALRAPRLQRLFTGEPVRLRIRCAAACDARAWIRRGGRVAAGTEASLAKAGSRTLLLWPNGFGTVLPRRPGPVTVRVRVSAPGSAASRTRQLPVRLAHRAVKPVPRLLDARAVRRGQSVVVSWRTSFPARQVSFFVDSAATGADTDFGVFGSAQGKGRTHFRVRLRPERPGALRRVVIHATDREGGHERTLTVPVTG
jgi:hypothetical protein